MEELSKEFGFAFKNFQMKYLAISKSNGLEGCRQVDVDVVKKLLNEKYPRIAVEHLQKLTLHIS